MELYFSGYRILLCRPEHAYAAQMHARLKPATPASRLARVNCSIVVSPINISYSLYKYVGRRRIYNIVYTMLCGVCSSRARYSAHIIYNVIIRSCHRSSEGQGLRCDGLSACAYGHTLAGVRRTGAWRCSFACVKLKR